MGCGTLDWADLFDHVSELLSEEADAPVREHLASCDPCRADSGELMALSQGFWALGILTHVTGREAFADRARSEVREIMGDRSAIRSTGAWRAIASAESQRMRRARFRRRGAVRNAVVTAVAVAALLAAGVTMLFRFGAVAYLVDTWGPGIEDSLGTDLAEWGLRRTPAEVAELAYAKKDTDGVRALAGPVWRLLRRELSSRSCRVAAVVRLEFAHTLVLKEAFKGPVDPRELIAAAVLAADRVQEPPEPVGPEILGVVRKARRLWLAGDVEAAQKILIVPVTAREPLALYYSAVITADSEGLERGSPRLGRAAGKVPAVWSEVAWRWLRDGKPERARLALDSAPQDEVRAALAALVTAREK